MSCDHIYKVVLAGDSSVGKSSLLRRFADDSFQQSYLATIGVDFKFRTLSIDQKPVKLQIWDTAGQQRFRTITSAYYKGAHGILLVYDIQTPKTLQDIEEYWLGEVQKYGEKDVCIYIIGNKVDKIQEKQDCQKLLVDISSKHNVNYGLTSAKTGDGVIQIFTKLAEKCLQKHGKTSKTTTQAKSVIDDIRKKKKQFQLSNAKQIQNKKKCC